MTSAKWAVDDSTDDQGSTGCRGGLDDPWPASSGQLVAVLVEPLAGPGVAGRIGEKRGGD